VGSDKGLIRTLKSEDFFYLFEKNNEDPRIGSKSEDKSLENEDDEQPRSGDQQRTA
jgi:hypothetical protein